MKKENAINFLLYSMLGVTVGDTDERDEDRVKAAVIRAYSDATMQGAYNSLIKRDMKNRQELLEYSAQARKASGKLILEEIYCFFDRNCERDDFSAWHDALCNSIKNNYEKKNVRDGKKLFFTYGNAQKWVNMTIKYLCLIDALSEGFIFHERLCHLQSKFHIPVDNYIIKEVRSKTSVQPWSKQSWSNWSDSEYKAFRSASEKLCGSYPLDWENVTWIKQSKNRKHRDKSSLQDKYLDFFDEGVDDT